MKKLIYPILGILIFGYIILQNWAFILFKIISLKKGQVRGTIVSGSSSLTPPYKNGIFIGSVADAFYGSVQVQAIIANGKISDVQFLQHPSDRTTSIAINTYAMPNLKQEAIQSQGPNVDIVTGATQTSQAFIQSLTSALSQAK